jgi:glycine dehydrogenase subunit 1
MDYVSNQALQQEEMLKTIGVLSIQELFSLVPESLFHQAPKEDDGLSEAETLAKVTSLALKNTYPNYESYLGAGAYQHYIPAIVGAITSRSEFLTSYTPYQPEISQGLLQAIFEYQSVIAALTGMDVSNASVYDGASACAEAVMMALRVKKDKRVVVISEGLHPSYLQVVKQISSGFCDSIVTVPLKEGKTLLETSLKDAACFLVQSPNFFGVLEDSKILAKKARESDCLYIACGNPISYGLFSPPGEWGADIAVGESQPLGIALEFGGPYAGYMAAAKGLMRQLPGRIVGETVDAKGRRGFVLTLQAREQHIRREKATSNICTNQAHAALAFLVATLWYGPHGLKKLALTNYQRAHYLGSCLAKLPGFSVMEPYFNEFTLKCPCSSEKAIARFQEENILPGVALQRFFPKMDRHLLVAVTEMKTLKQLDRFIEIAKTF